MAPTQILLATDLSSRSDRALDRAAALAVEWQAKLLVVHAIEAPIQVPDGLAWRHRIDPRDVALQRIRADLREPAAIDVTVIVERGDPTTLVLDTASTFGAELILTGVARDETLGRALLGKTVEALARRATVPVLTVKSRPREPYRDIVVPSDFSEGSRTALVTALEMFPAAHVELFHAYKVVYEGLIIDKLAARESTSAKAREEARAFLAGIDLPADRRVSVRCEYGPPEPVLRELVLAGGIDLVVVGTRGRGRLAELFLGSVAQSLLSGLPGDVMLVPRAA